MKRCMPAAGVQNQAGRGRSLQPPLVTEEAANSRGEMLEATGTAKVRERSRRLHREKALSRRRASRSLVPAGG